MTVEDALVVRKEPPPGNRRFIGGVYRGDDKVGMIVQDMDGSWSVSPGRYGDLAPFVPAADRDAAVAAVAAWAAEHP